MFRLFLLSVLVAAPALARPALAQSLPAPFAPDLSKPDAPFVVPYSQEGAVASPVKVEKIKNGVRMTAIAGGSMGVKLNVPPFDADNLTRLSFDYTRSPDARVNLFFRVNGRYFAVVFCGPKQVRAGTPIIYDTDVRGASGHLEIPLRAALRAQMPDADSLKVDEVLAGNWINAGYLMAGIGGNGPGANWTISNFKMARPDVKPSFGPGRWEGQELVIPAKDLDALSFKKFLFKCSIVDADQIHYDSKRGAFIYDASAVFEALPPSALNPIKDAQVVDYSVSDAVGKPLTQGKATFHYSDLPVPPPPHLFLSGVDEQSWFADFESDHSPFNFSSNVATSWQRDAINPYNGKWCGRFTNTRLASPFDVQLGSNIDVARRPVLTFAYRCDDRLRLDLNLTWNNAPYSIRFTDSDNPNPRLGDLRAVRDGQWHLATFDLLAALKKTKPAATDFKIQNLQFSDTGWPGNVNGLNWWLDDFKWAPATPGKLEGEVGLLDASGTQSISYALDQNPATSPEAKATGGPKLSLDLTGKTGLWWLHLRAQNGASKWSDTAHYPLWCG